MTRLAKITLLALFTAHLPGCDESASSDGGCVFETDVYSLDEPTPLGLTGRERQQPLIGVWQGQLAYHGGTDEVSASPAAGSAAIEFELLPVDDEARHVYGSASGGNRLACPSYLETTLSLRLDSDDGVFAESFTVMFEHSPGPKQGVVLDVLDHDFAQFSTELVSPDRYSTRGTDLWLKMEAGTAEGFIITWGGEPPVEAPDGTTSGGGPRPTVVSWTAQRQ